MKTHHLTAQNDHRDHFFSGLKIGPLTAQHHHLFNRMKTPRLTAQRGIVAVEFALVSIILFTLLIGIMEMGRILFYWNSATEATRLGARVAVICAPGDAAIKARMTEIFPVISATDIQIAYLPSGCDAASCASVTVSLAPAALQTAIPFVPLTLMMPSSSTTLPREVMSSSIAGAANPACG